MIRAIIMEWVIGWNSILKKKKDYVFMMCIINYKILQSSYKTISILRFLPTQISV